MPIEVRANTNYKVLSTDIIEQVVNFVSKEYVITTAPILPASLIDTTLWSWGHSQITGRGARSSPVQNIMGASNWKHIVSGATDSVAAINKSGQLWMWGINRNGKLGDNTTTDKSSPVQTVSGGNNWRQASTAYSHSVGVKTDGTLWTWGNNSTGALGTNDTTHRSSPVQTVSTATNWKRATCGNSFSAGLKSDGSLWLWGSNTLGQLGDGTTANRSSPVQTAALGNNWRSMSCGDTHTAAIKDDGTLWTWGDNTYGQLGDGTKTNRSSPVQTISGGNNWKFISCGSYFTAAIKTDNSLWLWGHNGQGKLGVGNTVHRSSPVQTISGGNDWLFVDCGSYHTAAIKADGSLWAWGQGTDGKLGDNTTTSKSSPIQIVDQSTDWLRVAAASNATIAIKDDTYFDDTGFSISGFDTDNIFVRKNLVKEGNLWGWGHNLFGQLGNGNTTNTSSPVQTVTATRGWKEISTTKSGNSSIAAIKNGKLYTWGDNTNGQLGNLSLTHRSSPVLIQSARNWKSVSMGGTFSLALEDTGSLWGWGSNTLGALGSNSATSSPIQIFSGIDWKKISSGHAFAGAIKTDNSLWTWGDNTYGQLGDNTTVHRSSPIQVLGSWIKIDSGPYHTAAIKNDGSLWMWGYGGDGRLGNSDLNNQSSPIQITGTWREVSCGANHTAAIKTDGSLWTWGNNVYGQLGDNSTTLRNSPVQTIADGNNWKYVSAGSSLTAAIKQDDTLWVWGFNSYGQLSDNTTVHRSSPVQVANTVNWKSVVAGNLNIFGIKEPATGVVTSIPPVQELFIVATNISEIQLPGNFNPANNTVEILGAGANGGDTGGGGAAFAKSTNVPLSPGSTIKLRVATVGVANSYVGTADAVLVAAASASGATGGQASASIGNIKYNGGNGVNGGGGAAASESGAGADGNASGGGPLGGAAGTNGTNATATCNGTSNPGNTGGNGSPGSAGGDGNLSGSGGGKGGNGGAGSPTKSCSQTVCFNNGFGTTCSTTYYTQAAGSSGIGSNGGNGGYYGGGGGARGSGSTYGSQGVGAQGYIRIRWQPTF